MTQQNEEPQLYGQALCDRSAMNYLREKFGSVKHELWTIEEAARFMNLSKKTISNLIYLSKKHPTDGDIPYIKKSRRCLRFDSFLLANWYKRYLAKKYSPMNQSK
jgi:hypothetical protein